MKKKTLVSRLIILSVLSLTGIKSYPQIANTLSPADKVFGLSKFWQEVNYNFIQNRIEICLFKNQFAM